VATFGFSSAVSFATECIDRLHATAQAHSRIMVIEVMGRYAGWIALHAGIAGQADAILIPEIPYDIRKVADHLRKVTSGTRQHAIVVVAEGAKPAGGDVSVKSREPGRTERLGGIGNLVSEQLQELTGQETRCTVLGHLLRGGSPNAQDRIFGLGFGAGAVYALHRGMNGVMVALNPPKLEFVPIEDAVAQLKVVPVDCETVLVSRTLGICFGDLASVLFGYQPRDAPPRVLRHNAERSEFRYGNQTLALRRSRCGFSNHENCVALGKISEAHRCEDHTGRRLDPHPMRDVFGRPVGLSRCHFDTESLACSELADSEC
jgi:hypothetical protein